MKATKREINSLFLMLDNWKCFKHLTEGDKRRIKEDLNRIAINAIFEHTQLINDAARDIRTEIEQQ